MNSEEQKRKDERRRYLLLLLGLLTTDTGKTLAALAMRSLRNPGSEFYPAAMLLLRRAHSDAIRIGRTLAGTEIPFTYMDQAAGDQAALDQSVYLTGFASDLTSGRYTNEDGNPKEKSIVQRSDLYGLSLVGTANDAWRRTQPNDEKVWWILDQDESDHCTGCPAIESKNPWTMGTLPTVPGAGYTPCVGHCKCSLRTEDGSEAFPGGTHG